MKVISEDQGGYIATEDTFIKPGVYVRSSFGVSVYYDVACTVTSGGILDGPDIGVLVNEAGSAFVNTRDGYVHGEKAIAFANTCFATNYGTVAGDQYGVTEGPPPEEEEPIVLVTFKNFGTLSGREAAIFLTADASLTNTGTIDGDIRSSGTTTFKNAGHVSGNVVFGDHGDVYDGRSGTMTGAINGGGGDDVYIFDDTATAGKIVEADGAGVDTIESDAFSLNLNSFTNIENATLLGSGAFNLTGNEFDNVLTGNGGRNTLSGGAGDDTYFVQNATDRIVELANGGLDKVHSTVSFVLGSQIETLYLEGALAFDGTGNTSNNTIIGNGNDNIIDGKAGADSMIGYGGNDTYYVDNVGDRVNEFAGNGTDTVHTTVDFDAAGQSIEVITLDGTRSIAAIGTNDANTFYDNAGDNTLTGLGGNDVYYVRNIRDKIVEASAGGNDTIHSTVSRTLDAFVENLILDGTGNIDGTGSSFGDTITGNTGSNVITGAGGDDRLRGGGGNDTFVYHSGFGRDTIGDFSATAGVDHDVIQVDKTIFADFNDLLAHTSNISSAAQVCRITYDSANSITLIGLHKEALDASDFKFV